MEMVRMFDAIEIKKETNINFLDIYRGNFCNDSAVPWWVEDEEDENESYEKINSYFLAHGAVPGEKVWIDITW